MPERVLTELQREWEELGPRLAAAGTTFRPGGPPFPTTGPGLYAELEEVLALWRDLRRAGLARHAGKYVNTGWTLRELLAHLASWAEEFRREAQTIAESRAFDYAIPFALSIMGPNAWNQDKVEARRGLTLKTILDQFEDETRRLQDLVLGLPREVLMRPATLPLAPSGDPRALVPGNVAVVVSGKCTHDRYHLGQIRRWLADREPRGRRKSDRGGTAGTRKERNRP